jgi:hypothetical protein
MASRAHGDEWLPPLAGGGVASAREPSRRSVARALHVAAAGVLLACGLLSFLIAFAMPAEPGSVTRPGLLIPWYLLPVIETIAAWWSWPGRARRSSLPLLAALAGFSGWLALFALA